MNSIQLMCRVKPNFKQSPSCVNCKNNEIKISKQQKGYLDPNIITNVYEYDRVFDDQCANMDVYNHLGVSMLKNVIKQQKNVTFYVYGQTGSGKTHTLLGGKKEEGFFPILLSDILEIGYIAQISAIEIYNNKCYDLFQEKRHIAQRANGSADFVLPNVEKKKMKGSEDIRHITSVIADNRQVGLSSENSASSRSHLLITVFIDGKVINILDLAGCEKAHDAICKDRRAYKENGEINQSLFALKECIRALLNRHSHIPYRRSELTKLLKTSFEPNHQTYILATVSQEKVHSVTTLDVMNYISSIKNIKTVLPKNNIRDAMMGTPRFQHLFSHQHILEKLNKKEKELLEAMVKRQSTRGLLEPYKQILDEKRRLLD